MPRITKLNQSQEQLVTYSVLDRDVVSTDFLKDPSLFKDPLPQPYRRIDKILQEILDQAWNIYEKKENERTTELSKPRPTKFNSAKLIENIGNVSCMTTSNDENNEILFVGQQNSLICVDASGMIIIDKIDLFSSESIDHSIKSIKSCKLKPLHHLVISISELGSVYMNLFVINKLYQIQPISDLPPDSERKLIYHKSEVSKNGDLIALFVESKSNIYDCYIEVYKCLKEQWFQTSDQIAQNEIRKQSSRATNNINQQELTGNNNGEQFESSSSIIVSSNNNNDELNAPSTTSATTNQSNSILSKPQLVCRIRPPVNQFKIQLANPTTISNLLSNKTNDLVTNDLIGLGINNCLTKASVDLKTQLGEKIFNLTLNEDYVNELNGSNYEIMTEKNNAHFEFMPSNRLMNSIETTNDLPCSLAVCWNKSNNLLFYPLNKITKDLECKYEYTMTYSSEINLVSTTKCKNLISFALANNNIVVFDLNSGIERTCVHIDNQEPIKQIGFLPITQSSKSLNLTNEAKLIIETILVCLTADGKIYLVDCSLGPAYKPRLIFEPQYANQDDKLIQIIISDHIPDLLICISETKKIYAFDLKKQKLVCELLNEIDKKLKYEIALDECLKVALAFKSHNLYIKSIIQLVDDDEKQTTGLVCQSLNLIPILDEYFGTTIQLYPTCLPINANLNDRIKNLMRLRIDEQPARKERLKNIWSNIYQQKSNKIG